MIVGVLKLGEFDWLKILPIITNPDPSEFFLWEVTFETFFELSSGSGQKLMRVVFQSKVRRVKKLTKQVLLMYIKTTNVIKWNSLYLLGEKWFLPFLAFFVIFLPQGKPAHKKKIQTWTWFLGTQILPIIAQPILIDRLPFIMASK